MCCIILSFSGFLHVFNGLSHSFADEDKANQEDHSEDKADSLSLPPISDVREDPGTESVAETWTWCVCRFETGSITKSLLLLTVLFLQQMKLTRCEE